MALFCNLTLLKLSSPCILIFFFFFKLSSIEVAVVDVAILKKKNCQVELDIIKVELCLFFQKEENNFIKIKLLISIGAFFSKKKRLLSPFRVCTFSCIIFNFITDNNITYFIIIPVIIFLTSYLFHFLECNCARPTKIH